MDNYQHLHKDCIPKLEMDIDDRIQEIHKPRWIGYPTAQDAMHKLEGLLSHPRVSRMPNMLLVGATNNGKTEIVKRFCQRHLPDESFDTENLITPTMYFEAPPTPSEADFYTHILCKLYERVPASSIAAKRERTISVLKKIELKVMIIDELHNILAGSSTKQQHFLNMIKYLSNQLQVSIVGCGTSDLLRAVSVDPQIQNRFPPMIIPRWRYDKSFRQLLSTFERVIPLKERSNLHSPELSKKILAITEGSIGEISTLLNTAASYSLRNGLEVIDLESIQKCGYIGPGMRVRESISAL
ncbi:TniB family NTP-binding protein [Bacterioplanoides sp.]|uniref:TniB family NTP-binding protein n=1 Tax=Bacterioplanoides sp. TaxID=2066072 RepID=UPI003AFFD6C2